MTLSILKPILWRQIQRENFTCIDELSDYLELSETNRKKLLADPRFPLNVPRRLAAKMAKDDIDDPLFLQFVPLAKERETTLGFVADPVCDSSFRKEKKLLHKYSGRALWLVTSACAMNCRYCFRQNFPYETASTDFSAELDYLRKNTDIKEIILSGGDPLSLSDAALMQLLYAFDSIPHLKRIRFHTRFPIGIPERIDRSFLEMLSGIQKKIVIIIHCNHPRELDAGVAAALREIAALSIPILNQSVLLKGVNDDEATFLALCEALVDAGVIPYYLHMLDPVEGSGHFAVTEERGQALIRHVQENLSGYGVPRLVREIAGARSKTFL